MRRSRRCQRLSAPWASFFRAATNFNFMTFGFDDPANLTHEEGAPHQLVASTYRITTLDEATEAKLGELVKKAAS